MLDPKVYQQSLDSLNTRFPRRFLTSQRSASELPTEVREKLLLFDNIYKQFGGAAPNIEAEIKMLLFFMDQAELYTHHDVAEVMRKSKDTVFEIYDMSYNQLYRSFSFLKFETYDIADLMTHSNFQLYDREDYHKPNVQRQIDDSIRFNEVTKLKVPVHLVWEAYGRANHNYYWEMDLGYSFPIFKEGDNKPYGFFVSHTTKQVFKPLPLRVLPQENVQALTRC